MADNNRLPPLEEARVRTAALVAAQRMNWDVPRAVLDYIVATSDPAQSPEALAVRAASIVQYVKNHPDRPDFANATDRQVQGFFQTIHGQVVHLFGGLPYVLASRDEEAGADDSGAGAVSSFMRDDTFMASPAGRAMQNYARQCGLGWAAESPDILRLGHGAIEALRDANFRRESFHRLRDAGFEGREAARIAVGISRYAVHHGLDANRVAEETADAVTSFGAGSPEARRRWIERFGRFYDNPNDQATQEEMDRGLTEMETSGTAEQRDRARRMREITGRVSAARLTADTASLTADTAVVTADTATASDRAVQEAREARERAEAAERAGREAERTRAEEAERAAAAARARVAAAMGEEPATKGPAIVVQEGPPTKAPVVQEGPPSKEAPPVRLTAAAPGS